MTAASFVFGLHAVETLLQVKPQHIRVLYVQTERHDKKIEAIIALALSLSIAVERCTKSVLDDFTQHANHQGVVVRCAAIVTYNEEELFALLKEIKEPPFLLILDGVQDPHNLGACLRSADAAGVHAVIVPKDKAVGLTATVNKVASGAAATIPFVSVTNIVRVLEKLKTSGVWIYGAAAEATQSLYEIDLSGPLAFVLGAEGTGLRRLTREHCDALLKIPMRGSVESLNVSVATGILLFEARRQRS